MNKALLRKLYACLLLSASVPVLICMGLAAVLMRVAQTWQGTWAGGFFLLGAPTLLFLLYLPLRFRLRGLAFAMGGVMAAVFCYVNAHSRAGKGEVVNPLSPFESVYLGKPGYVRHSPANLVPEIDQFTLGSYVVPWLDPYIDQDQAARIRQLFTEVYSEMRRDLNAYRPTGSTMNYAYRELFGLPWDSEHLYLTHPAAGKEPLPAMLFLHGSGGNFKGYMWVWQAFSTETQHAVIAPDFGFGNWRRDHRTVVIDRTIDYIRARADLSTEGMLLAGLSNGGLGVTRAAIDHPERWKALLYVSPVMEPRMMEALGQALKPHNTPVYVIHGEEDLRIPAAYIEDAVARLRKQGIRVELDLVPKEDHFLFFSDRERVTAFAARAARRE